ncbi:MAG: peptidoglycan-binding protein [Bacteroidales bacterium]|nr:peptidoglycan-binding protein [Bacteroidales bacterium]
MNEMEPEKTAVKPEKTAVKPEKTAVKPEKTAVKPEKTAVKPEKTAVKPGKTAVKPGKTAAKSEKSGKNSKNPASTSVYKNGDSVAMGGHSLTVVRPLGSGSEGDIYVVKEGKKTYALKLSRPEFGTNTRVLSALQQLKGKGYIVDIEDYGDGYELMEYVRGDSAAYAKLKGNAQAILAIAVNTAMDLDKMHECNVLHKDVKPANILIRNSETWECVLCDFGIADILKTENSDGVVRKYCVTRRNRTPIYAAPEIYKEDNATVNDDGSISSEMTPKSDFYSLGMTILSLWMGEDAISRIEDENSLRKIRGHIPVPDDMPDPLNHITRGLLISDPSKRWDFKSISDFLNGNDMPVEEDETVADLNIVYNATKHQTAHSLKDLARFMEEDFELAEGYLYRGRLSKWLSAYPELQNRLDNITENRFRKDHEGGVIAAIYALCPDMPFKLSGVDRKSGEEVETEADTLKDVSDFCSRAVPFYDELIGNKFVEWVRIRAGDLADALPTTDIDTMTYMLRVQTIDPLSDINLCNDPSNPNYAMSQEGIARTLNEAYNIFWNRYGGDFDTLLGAVQDEYSEYKYRELTIENVANISASICDPQHGPNYLNEFMKTKGARFNKQISWVDYCLDYDSKDNKKKAGPKDDGYVTQAAWMRIIKGFGINPVYHLVDEDADVTTVSELMRFPKKVLKKEYEERGLRGWLAVQHHEDPYADLGKQYSYEKLLAAYVDDVRRIDADDRVVKRFDEASDKARSILGEGKSKIHRLNIRTLSQYAASILFGVVPCIVLTVLIISSIIAHPTLDMSGFEIQRFIWPVGLVVGVILYFVIDSDGCLVPIILGMLGAALLFVVTKFLASLLLYFFLLAVLATLVFFVIKTLFFRSDFAKQVRHFTKPGFEEYVLEPLYYAFSNETVFDSSLNGMIDDRSIDSWKNDLKKRRNNMLIFIGITLIFCALGLLLPRNGALSDNPYVQKVEQLFVRTKPHQKVTPKEEKIEMPVISKSLRPGDRGDAVTAMQKRLAQLGYYRATATGTFDNTTRAAVVSFQRANGLTSDGIAGKKTIQKLFSSSAKRKQ